MRVSAEAASGASGGGGGLAEELAARGIGHGRVLRYDPNAEVKVGSGSENRGTI